MRESKQNRIERLYAFDKQVSDLAIMGLDEAGRGCLAGPIYAASVILDPQNIISDLNDSKKIQEEKRYLLLEEIKEKSISYGIGIVSPEIVDENGIQYANYLAFQLAYQECIQKISSSFSFRILVDGNYKNLPLPPYQNVVKGDTLSASIAAASIVAKASRDLFMKTQVHPQYPIYGFDSHKGYGTKVHCAAIKDHGICPIHRISFCNNLLKK